MEDFLEKRWSQIGKRHHHGINIPLFSLRSLNSCGVGEYLDLLPLIDWCSSVGFGIIQLLPLNDTGPETSPYSSLSAFALNPIHLSLTQLPNPPKKSAIAELQALSHAKQVPYEEIYQLKEQLLHRYFAQEFPAVRKSAPYQEFLLSNPWLNSYARFKSLKEQHNWAPWESWHHSKEPTSSQIDYHTFIQYLCFSQLKQVRQYGEKKQVFIKGDLPFLIVTESADVWSHPDFFQSDFYAGSHPDAFTQEGQNWHLPIYNWVEKSDQILRWWRDRLHTAAPLYQLYRIDHIAGLFRVWAIPKGKKASEGYFIPQNEREWVPQGRKILSHLLTCDSILPIGEDLALLPDSVRDCLSELGIPGTKVIRWERRYGQYIPFDHYPPLSMTTVSTHDSETLQEWWKERPSESAAFARFMGWNHTEELSVDQRREILLKSHQTASLFHINLLQEYFPLVPGLAWPKPIDERINFPGTTIKRNWRYRFRPWIEEFTQSEALTRRVSDLLAQAN